MEKPPDFSLNEYERSVRGARLASLEADVAYFQARLEIIGEPQTANQLAQLKVFKLLKKSLGDTIVRTKRRMIEDR